MSSSLKDCQSGWAPEFKYPSQLGEVVNAYHYLLKEHIQAKDIIVMGGSAGANLALSFLLHAASPHPDFEPVRNVPRGIVLQSPWWDLEMRADQAHSFFEAKNDYLSIGVMDQFASVYIEADAVPPLQSSPLHYLEGRWRQVWSPFSKRDARASDPPRKYADLYANPIVNYRSKQIWEKALSSCKLTAISGDDEVLHASVTQQVDALKDLHLPIKHHIIPGGVHESAMVDFYLGRNRSERRRGVELTAALIIEQLLDTKSNNLY